MAFRTMTARYPGTCRRCEKAGLTGADSAIRPGQKIRFGGRGLTYHMAATCPASESTSWKVDEFQAQAAGPATSTVGDAVWQAIVRVSAKIHPDWTAADHAGYLATEEGIAVPETTVARYLAGAAPTADVLGELAESHGVFA